MSILLQNKIQESTLHKSGEKLGTYYLASDPTHYEIQRSNTFMFYVNGLSKMLDIPQNTWAADNADDVIRLSVNKASIPHFTQSAISLKRGNNTMKFAGTPEFDQGSISVTDFIGAGTKDILMAWQGKSYDVKTEKVGLATDYKKDAYLLEYTPDYQLVRTWKLMGCWISSISEPEYSHDSGADKRSIDVKIEYDKAWIDTSDIG